MSNKITEERNEVTVHGKRLETLLIDPAGPQRETIVLLHEGLGSIAMWKDFPFRLAERTGYRVFAYSRYGHGHSARLAEKRNVDYMHHEGEVVLPALLEQMDIQHPVLMGHSDGGSIALIFAGKKGDRHQLCEAPFGPFRQMVPVPFFAPRGLILEAPHVFVEDLTVQSIARAKTIYETTDLPQRLGRYHAHVDDTFWGWNDIWLDPRFRSWNIEEYLDTIRCPILSIQGEDDEYGTARQLEAIARRVAATQTLLLPHCGHSPHRDQADTVLSRIVSFLAELR